MMLSLLTVQSAYPQLDNMSDLCLTASAMEEPVCVWFGCVVWKGGQQSRGVMLSAGVQPSNNINHRRSS
jgi:hypothetical protein